MMLNKRKLEIRNYKTKSAQINKNATLMDESLRHVKIKGLKTEILDQNNYVILHKKLCFKLELVEVTER